MYTPEDRNVTDNGVMAYVLATGHTTKRESYISPNRSTLFTQLQHNRTRDWDVVNADTNKVFL